MSGANATSGSYQLEGIQMVVDYVNENGGVKSMNGANVELVVCDTAGNVETGMTPFRSMVVDYLGGMTEEGKFTKIAVVYDAGDWGTSENESFKAVAEQIGAEVVVSEAITTNSSDLSSVVNKIKNSGAEVVFAGIFLNDAILFAKQPWIGMIIAGLVAGLLSILIGYPVFKLKGMYYSLASIALMSVFELIFNNEMSIFGIYIGGPNGLRFTMTGSALDMQFSEKANYYYVALALLIIVMLVSDRIQHTKMGYYFRSIRANPDAAASLGVNVLRYKLTAHFISAFFTAIGGAVYVTTFLYVNAKTVFGMDLSFAMMLFCILGGANTLWGPVIGAIIMVPIQQALRIAAGSDMAAMSSLIYGLALCLVIMFMPDGILGLVKQFAAKRKAERSAEPAAAASEDGGDINV